MIVFCSRTKRVKFIIATIRKNALRHSFFCFVCERLCVVSVW
nr:MAG TPA: hypothetical protein [Caudoviricetes sp.]